MSKKGIRPLNWRRIWKQARFSFVRKKICDVILKDDEHEFWRGKDDVRDYVAWARRESEKQKGEMGI